MDRLHRQPAAIFCDFNGTITDRDTLAALVEFYGHHDVLEHIARARALGSISLRERIAAEARFLTCSLEEATLRLRSIVSYDETFTRFSRQCARQGVALVILTSGIEPLVAEVLAYHRVRDVPVVGNGVFVTLEGWRVRFRDATPEGNAKAPYLEKARKDGVRTIAIGDDESDFEIASIADVSFAKRESVLDRYLRETRHPHYVFDTFHDVFERLVWERVLDD